MWSFILKRLAQGVITVWFIATATFFAMHNVPGDPLLNDRAMTAAIRANVEAKYGLDKPVADFLEEHDDVQSMENDIKEFLTSWLPKFEKTNRSYMTIAIGCTGGQHRSVYVCNKLFQHFQPQWSNVQIKHRELGNPGNRN